MPAVAISPQLDNPAEPRTVPEPAPAFKILPAPALLAAVSFACGITAAQAFWTQPGPLLIGLLLCFVVSVIATLQAPRIAFACAVIVFGLLGLFRAEVQPRPPITTPLTRIAEQTPTPTPSTRRLGIATAHFIEGVIVRTTAVRTLDSLAPYSDTVRREQSQQIDIRVAAVDGVPLPSPGGLRVTLYAPANVPWPAARCGSA